MQSIAPGQSRLSHKMRSRLLTAVFVAHSLLIPILTKAANLPTTCAIRWDAWYTNGPDDPARYTATALSPKQFHRLAPLHAQFDSGGKITWAPSQKAFDGEIRAAHKAHLCWAYLLYGTNNVIDLNNSMMRGLAYHLKSSIKSQVKYAVITATSLIGRSGSFENAAAATVDLMSDPDYQHVLINGISRPLLFIFYEQADLARFFSGSLVLMKDAIDSIRQSSISRPLGDPYIVILTGPARTAEAIRIALEADAISAYVAGERKGGIELWSQFEPSIEAQWNSYAEASSTPTVPTLRSGADIRARCQSPPPFEHRFPPGFDCAHFYVVNPTLPELATEFRHAIAWLANHRTRESADLLLLYAWSECDESGNCLMPTIGDPTGKRLKAISAAFSTRANIGAPPP